MNELEKIREGYKYLFYETGKIEFFMRAKNIEKLEKNIALVEKLSQEDDLLL